MFSWLPKNVSTYGGDIDAILYLIYYIITVWFVLAYGAIIYCLIKYRRRPGQRARYLPGATFRQYGWILVLGAIVLVIDVGIDIRGEQVWHKVKGVLLPADVQVEVTGKQFIWQVGYPGPDGTFKTADDRQIDGELHVPVGKVVHVTLRAEDVIHSFFVPNLRLKQDAMPGRSITLWFEVTEPGVYLIPCAELCGSGHTGMLGQLTAHTPEAYEAWRKQQWPTS